MAFIIATCVNVTALIEAASFAYNTAYQICDNEVVCNRYPTTTDGKTFIEVYDEVVPDSIKVRNNNLLGDDGWGGSE